MRNLSEIGVDIEESMAVTKLVSSLPDAKYLAFKKAWDSVSIDQQSMPMLFSRLKKEDLEANQHDLEVSSSESLEKATRFKSPKWRKPMNLKKKRKGVCKNNGRPHHWPRDYEFVGTVGFR